MLKPTFIDFLTTKLTLLQKLMEGVGLSFDLKLMKNVDDAILDLINYIDQTDGRDESELSEEEKALLHKKKQDPIISMITLALKTKMEV